MRLLKGFGLFSGFLATAAVAAPLAVETSPRPLPRPATLVEKVNARASAEVGFNGWIEGFRVRALSKGVPNTILDQALNGITFDPVVIDRDLNQNEFTKTIWDYLSTAVSDVRIRNGQRALADRAALLQEIEERYGVEKEIVTAIWGLESAYGAVRGDHSIIQALASLASASRRAAFFEGELIAALTILQNGDTTPANMRGSWAGAMGHTQFMPTSFLRFAVDHTGDGRRDIWSDDPTDALASTAAYLAHWGWTEGQPWGVEVTIPEGFDYSITGERVKKTPAEWAALGIRDIQGREVPDHGRASILLPAGHQGAAFMIFDNFHVLEKYNTADAYVIAVGHLADRINGGAGIQHDWPRADRALTREERIELQERLTAAGYSTEGVDGKIGPNTVAAVRAYQMAQGLVPDGYANLEILTRLR